jgi:hypothetical protein
MKSTEVEASSQKNMVLQYSSNSASSTSYAPTTGSVSYFTHYLHPHWTWVLLDTLLILDTPQTKAGTGIGIPTTKPISSNYKRDGEPHLFIITINPMMCYCLPQVPSGKPCLHILTVVLVLDYVKKKLMIIFNISVIFLCQLLSQSVLDIAPLFDHRVSVLFAFLLFLPLRFLLLCCQRCNLCMWVVSIQMWAWLAVVIVVNMVGIWNWRRRKFLCHCKGNLKLGAGRGN